jgi:hypothetical protein
MTTVLKFNGVSSAEFGNIQVTDVNMYYHSYNGTPGSQIMVLPFCLDTSADTGTTNFSRLDKFEIIYPQTLLTGMYLYAVRYNVLKFANGQASLLYN